MQKNKQLAAGILFAALLIIFVIIAGLTAMAETAPPNAAQPTQTIAPPVAFATLADNAGNDDQQPTVTLINTLAAGSGLQHPTATLTPTFTPIAGGCAYPPDWQPITISVGDTLQELAGIYKTTVEVLVSGNCLFSEGVQPGTLLYVPASGIVFSTSAAAQTKSAQSSSATTISCGRPAGWISYRIKKGNTLFSLAQAYGVTIADLQFANCLGNSTNILTGTDIYVPDVVKTNTPLVASPTSTSTKTPVPPTATFTATTVPAATATATETGTATMTATATATATNTATATPTDTPPVLTIVSPLNGANTLSTTVNFVATAIDADDGDISASITWDSDKDGAFVLDGGGNFVLTVDVHVITATVTDLGGNTVTTQITITVP